jgi:hypothetical protein
MFLLFLRTHGRLKPEGSSASDSKSIVATDFEAEVRNSLLFFFYAIFGLFHPGPHFHVLAGHQHVLAPRGCQARRRKRFCSSNAVCAQAIPFRLFVSAAPEARCRCRK